jgi:hypothetical protein
MVPRAWKILLAVATLSVAWSGVLAAEPCIVSEVGVILPDGSCAGMDVAFAKKYMQIETSPYPSITQRSPPVRV